MQTPLEWQDQVVGQVGPALSLLAGDIAEGEAVPLAAIAELTLDAVSLLEKGGYRDHSYAISMLAMAMRPRRGLDARPILLHRTCFK